MSSKKAMIAMSGGVDSSVSAFLTVQNGFECTGATMKLFCDREERPTDSRTCCSADDVEDARSVCFKLDMPHYVFNFSLAFEKEVVNRFIAAYECGRTPNPCVDCNRYLKFRELLRRAIELGHDYLVTGHYAQIERRGDGRYLLKRAADGEKDQSYVLWSLTQFELAHTMFPLGKITKQKVREIAEREGFVNAQKRDSQDICFVPDGDYAGFIERRTQKTYPEGDFIDSDGNFLGKHRGIIHYTVGQRKGLLPTLPGKMYVKSVNARDNTVTLASDEELFTKTLVIKEINLISADRLAAPIRAKVAVRYRGREVWSTVSQIGDDELLIELDSPQRAVTPGQSAVLYDGDYVIGGGIIQ